MKVPVCIDCQRGEPGAAFAPSAYHGRTLSPVCLACRELPAAGTRLCVGCGHRRPLVSGFALARSAPRGHRTRCLRCKRASTDRATAHRQADAQRAGIRNRRCALCKAPMIGRGACALCLAALAQLGGSEAALQNAVRYVRYMSRWGG